MRSSVRESGQAAVEFALIVPMLLLILLGFFDFGRAFFAYSVVSNAAREGARAGIFTSATDTDISGAVKKMWVGLDAQPIVAISPTFPRLATDTISVTVQYSFKPVTPVIDAFLPGGQITLIGSSVMDVE